MRGFSLIEALIALLVMSFGMLAIAGFQVTLTRNSDVAKQRTEATQLAQQKMEELRAYGQVSSNTGTPHIFNYTDDLISGPPVGSPDVITTNATFNRTWTVTPNTSNTEKWINVKVAWTDRTGAGQEVQLLSVISKFDPQDIGTLVTGPGGVNVRKPKNRNLNIPYPAVTLSDRTKSAFIPPPGNTTYIFDNVTGNIIGGCTGISSSTLVEGLDISSFSCASTSAYLLTGYVRFDTSNNPSSAEPGNPGAANETLPLAINPPLSLDSSNNPSPNTGGSPSMICYSQRQKVMSTSSTSPVTISTLLRSGSTVTVTANNHGFAVGQTVAINAVSSAAFIGAFTVASVTTNTFTYTLPPPLPAATSATGGTAALLARITIAEGASVTGYSTVVSKFVSYACIVTPVDHDGLNSTAPRWWGEVTINPNTVSADGTVWILGTTSSTYKVCRYSADYNANGSISNSEHPLWYRGVTGALDGQNYLVIKGNQPCPTGQAANPLANPPIYADNTTADHQPTGVLSFQCASSTCSGSNKTVLEPSTSSTDISMD
jgi:Tfp pilus assembly protein PilV